MPRSCASTFTGGGASFMPRPDGRSGCVTTRLTRATSHSARRHGTANSGVPKKIAFGRLRSSACGTSLTEPYSRKPRSFRSGAGLRRTLDHRAMDQPAAQEAQVIDEQLAVEVIVLVLDRD